MSWNDCLLILPEIVLALGACLLLVIPVLGPRENARWAQTAMLLVLAAAAGALILALRSGVVPGDSLGRMLALDSFAVFFKFLLIAAMALLTLISSDFLRESSYSPWEYYSILAFALCGMAFMVSGTHLLSIWVGLELLSLSSYILAGYYKNETSSTEAATKYFVLGAMSSAILLYGFSLIYGACGSLALNDIRDAILAGGVTRTLAFGVLLMTAGLSFKIAAVPFHVWTPDVYVGAPTPITAFLSTASKVAAVAIFARIFYTALPAIAVNWSVVVAAIAALSMIVGNVAAVTQTNVKRMLAYSSIAHAGYVLLGILAMSSAGLESVLVYMAVYVFANIGIWATVLMLRRRAYAGEQIDDFQGLHARAPFVAFAMVVFLLSLGGIPPTAGFIGKYFLFAAAVHAGYGWLAIIAVLTSAVSMFYYFRLVVAMYLREGEPAEVAVTTPLRFVVGLCLAVTLVLGVVPQKLIEQVRASSKTMVATLARR